MVVGSNRAGRRIRLRNDDAAQAHAMSVELRKVQRAAGKAATARNELGQAVREARVAGHSLRVIAEAAGLSHEQIRRLSF
jgi:hypothetical protein